MVSMSEFAWETVEFGEGLGDVDRVVVFAAGGPPGGGVEVHSERFRRYGMARYIC